MDSRQSTPSLPSCWFLLRLVGAYNSLDLKDQLSIQKQSGRRIGGTRQRFAMRPVALLVALLLSVTCCHGWERLQQHLPHRAHERLEIPKILHYIYLDGYDAYVAGTQRTPSAHIKAWRDSCLLFHEHWTTMFWDRKNGKEFLDRHYSWFTPTWEAYPVDIARADALRPFLMHHYGGLYLDLDVQCFQDTTPFLKGHDVVLQASPKDMTGDRGVINCAMASVPRHPLWLVYANLFEGTKDEEHILNRTGPAVLAKAVSEHYHTPLPVPPGEHQDSELMVYPTHTWYVACHEPNMTCNEDLTRRLISGDIPYERVAGHHRFQHTYARDPHADNLLEHYDKKLQEAALNASRPCDSAAQKDPVEEDPEEDPEQVPDLNPDLNPENVHSLKKILGRHFVKPKSQGD
ncbi:hypothetical protein WJX72_002432 [[Myrmecia] bisecta]|uniref:Uncharacterized protein n=1 Tax=[Myrmecia] bisecta TaxID=41462 RepID=A0AAW1R5Q9_9CHLO